MPGKKNRSQQHGNFWFSIFNQTRSNKKKLDEMLNSLFNEPADSFSFIRYFSKYVYQVGLAGQKRNLSRVREKFLACEPEEFLAFWEQIEKTDVDLNEIIMISSILAGCGPQDQEKSIEIMQKIFNLMAKAPFTKGVKYLPTAIMLHMSLCLGTSDFWQVFLSQVNSHPAAQDLLDKYIALNHKLLKNTVTPLLVTREDVLAGKTPFPPTALNRIFIIPKQYQQIFSFRWRKLARKALEKTENMRRAYEWFENKHEQFVEAHAKRWREIKSRPRFGLRENGLDKVRIKVSFMREAGFQMLQFFPLEYSRARARFYFKSLDDLYSFEVILSEQSLSETIVSSLDNRSEDYIRWTTLHEQFLNYMAVDIMHRIMIQGGKKTNSLAPASIRENNRGSGNSQIRKATVVRPHFRALQPDQKASPQAQAAAKQEFSYLDALPEGKTFVRKHTRGEAEIIMADPLFDYTDQDLGYEPKN